MYCDHSRVDEVGPPSSSAEQTSHAPFGDTMVTISKKAHIQLKWDAVYWKRQHQRAIEREEELKQKIEGLEAQVRDLRQRLFGKKSERNATDNERQVKPLSGRPRGQRPGQPGHGRTCLSHLPVKEEVVDLLPADRECPSCGLPLLLFPRVEEAELIEIEVKAYRRRIRRPCYRSSCRCDILPGIVSAAPAARLIAKGKLGISVWVEVLLDKYLYSRPTHRLLQSWRSLGLNVSQGTIIGGLKQLAPLFEPLLSAFKAQQLTDGRCHADETGWRVFESIEGKVGYKWYLWVFCSASAMVYLIAPSRAAAVPMGHFATLLKETIVICDRYSGYKKMARIIGILLAFCWSHVRRDFLDVARGYPILEAWALTWVERIGTLYHLNQCRLKAQSEIQRAECEAELKAHLAAMVVARDQSRADQTLHRAAHKVLQSLTTHWPGLTVFVDHPEVPMDNNAAERALRNEVIGRKNYYGSGSVWAAEFAATMFTLLMTLVHCWAINPRLWLQDYLQSCAANGHQPPADLSAFLPWTMTPERLAYFRTPTIATINTS